MTIGVVAQSPEVFTPAGIPPNERNDWETSRERARPKRGDSCVAIVETRGLYRMLFEELSRQVLLCDQSPPGWASVRPGRPSPRMPAAISSPCHTPSNARPICCLGTVRLATEMLPWISYVRGKEKGAQMGRRVEHTWRIPSRPSRRSPRIRRRCEDADRRSCRRGNRPNTPFRSGREAPSC